MKKPNDGPRIKDKVDGILLINKSRGPSSNAVLQRVKFLLGAKKAGHTGSLDPMATGMLPICFGDATKISQYLLDADKAYTTTGLLGIRTNTADAMGEIVSEVENVHVSEDELRAVLAAFLGDIQQVPSMFSALKYQGRPLYHYARQGIEIERAARDITIHDLILHHFDGRQFSLTVRCSKGSYIRNLVEDIGEQLGVGAHVTALHRLYTAGFENATMISVDELEQLTLEERRRLLLPIDTGITYMSKLSLSAEELSQLRNGQPINRARLDCPNEIVRLYDDLDNFVGLGEWSSPMELKVKRLLSFAEL